MTRTTLALDPAVLRRLKARSQREGKSMGQVASVILARSLDDGPSSDRRPFLWLSRELGDPVVDLEDKEAVRVRLRRS